MQAPPPVPTLLRRLATTATNLGCALSGEDVEWRWRPGLGQWSLTSVVCHLRDVEREVHQARFKALLAIDGAFLSGVAADEWAEERHYQAQDGRAALDDFIAARQETLALLGSLPPDLWQRTGEHSYFGPMSLHELLFLAVEHDELHWEQVKALLAAQRATSFPQPL